MGMLSCSSISSTLLVKSIADIFFIIRSSSIGIDSSTLFEVPVEGTAYARAGTYDKVIVTCWRRFCN